MFSNFSKLKRLLVYFAFAFAAGLTACGGGEPPKLMKAAKQFDSDAVRDKHAAHMRKHHMDELLHKRDVTMYKGIRTSDNSLNACINCHIPEQHNGKVLRHTDPEHFCVSCHQYVGQQIDCFECHADHPVSGSTKEAEATPSVDAAKYHKNTANSDAKSIKNFEEELDKLVAVNSDAKIAEDASE